MLLSSDEEQELHTACRDSDVACVSRLFANHSTDADDSTAALSEAVPLDPTIVRILLQNGADVHVVNLRMIPRSDAPGELLRLLAEYGYDIKSDGHLILQLVLTSDFLLEAAKLIIHRDFVYDQKTLDWLLDQGVDINRTDNRRLDDGFHLAPGETDDSLHLLNNVAADCNIDLFDHLVSRGADPSLCTALHSASHCEDTESSKAMICHLLDKHSMDIDRNNDDLRNLYHEPHDNGSPLCSAIKHRNLAVVHELIKRGARVSDPKWSPVGRAIIVGFLPALEPLLRANADATEALKISASSGNIDAAKTCLQFDADPALALHTAIEREERMLNRLAKDAAYDERHPESAYEKSDQEIENERAEGRNRKAMIELLKSAMAPSKP